MRSSHRFVIAGIVAGIVVGLLTTVPVQAYLGTVLDNLANGTSATLAGPVTFSNTVTFNGSVVLPGSGALATVSLDAAHGIAPVATQTTTDYFAGLAIRNNHTVITFDPITHEAVEWEGQVPSGYNAGSITWTAQICAGDVAGHTATSTRTLQFANSGSSDTITAAGTAAGSFINDGWRPGMKMTISGTTSNNLTTDVIVSVTNTVITFGASTSLTNEGALSSGATLTTVSTNHTGNVVIELSVERIQSGTLDIDGDSFASAVSSGSSGTAVNATCGILSTLTWTTTQAEADNIVAGDWIRVKLRRATESANDTLLSDVNLIGVRGVIQ